MICQTEPKRIMNSFGFLMPNLSRIIGYKAMKSIGNLNKFLNRNKINI